MPDSAHSPVFSCRGTSGAGMHELAGGRFVLAILRKRIPRVTKPMGITTWIDIVHRANVLSKQKIQCPVECYPDLFVQPRQLAEVHRAPHPPSKESREIETENPRHTHPATDRSQ